MVSLFVFLLEYVSLLSVIISTLQFVLVVFPLSVRLKLVLGVTIIMFTLWEKISLSGSQRKEKEQERKEKEQQNEINLLIIKRLEDLERKINK